MRTWVLAMLLAAPAAAQVPRPGPPATCRWVESGYGPEGEVAVRVETVVDGLEVPWGVAFLPGAEGRDLLVTERPGRLRLVDDGKLVPEPILTVPARAVGEGGLLGLALHPDFAANRRFYLYYTHTRNGRAVNRVQRFELAPDRRSARPGKVIIDGIPASRYHNGGRIRFGPDGMLYVGTGDASQPMLAQRLDSLAGKLLRVTPDGGVPPDNPWPGSPVYVLGIRNTQGFDWFRPRLLAITDHGPSGELGRTGGDEISVALPGQNLGWPVIWKCQTRQGMVAPALAWDTAVPPGGAAFYTGGRLPAWRGDLLVGTLGSRHLHLVAFDPRDPRRVRHHAVYLRGDQPRGHGRLRSVLMGPDGALYVTTSNCDGRGTCPPDKDKILRLTGAPDGT